MLGLALFVGQAFIYNGITFNLGTLFSTFFGVSASFVPVFLIIYAAGNFLGPLLLGRLFDTVGRKPMITITYLGSAVVGAVMAIAVRARLAHLGVDVRGVHRGDVLPGVGRRERRVPDGQRDLPDGDARARDRVLLRRRHRRRRHHGPLLFGHLIASGSRSQVAIAFYIGSAVMAVGGIAEIFLGVRAEQQPLEDVATPLTAEDAEAGRRRRGPRADEAGERSAARAASAAERERRIRERPQRRAAWERTGAPPVPSRPGRHVLRAADGGHRARSPGTRRLERQIELIEQDARASRARSTAAGSRGSSGARYWGPGRFRHALQRPCARAARGGSTRGVIAPAEH